MQLSSLRIKVYRCDTNAEVEGNTFVRDATCCTLSCDSADGRRLEEVVGRDEVVCMPLFVIESVSPL